MESKEIIAGISLMVADVYGDCYIQNIPDEVKNDFIGGDDENSKVEWYIGFGCNVYSPDCPHEGAGLSGKIRIYYDSGEEYEMPCVIINMFTVPYPPDYMQ